MGNYFKLGGLKDELDKYLAKTIWNDQLVWSQYGILGGYGRGAVHRCSDERGVLGNETQKSEQIKSYKCQWYVRQYC